MWFLTTHLRMATVMASGDVAHGQITSGFNPCVWNTFRNASHEDTDPERVRETERGGERETKRGRERNNGTKVNHGAITVDVM